VALAAILARATARAPGAISPHAVRKACQPSIRRGIFVLNVSLCTGAPEIHCFDTCEAAKRRCDCLGFLTAGSILSKDVPLSLAVASRSACFQCATTAPSCVSPYSRGLGEDRTAATPQADSLGRCRLQEVSW
jgi:hypothetical protein